MFGAKALYVFEKILNSKDYEKLSLIKKKYLLLDVELECFQKINKLIEKGEKLPSTLLSPIFNIDPSLLQGYDKNLSFDVYFNLLLERYANLLYNKIKTTKALSDSSEHILSYLKEIYGELKEFFEEEKREKIDKIPEAFIDLYKEAIERNFSNTVISTSYNTLDEWLGGGFLPGETYAIVARMKMGKTMYLLWMLYSAIKQRKHCLFISMEMDIFNIVRRFLAIVMKDPAYIQGNQYIHKDWKKLKEIFEKKGIKFDFLNGSYLNNVKDIYALSYDYDAIYLDGAYLLPSHKNTKSEWEKVKSVVEELKNIALARKIPIVATYQFNRAAIHTADPDLEHIAYSDAIAQTAGAVISITNVSNKNNKKNKNNAEEANKARYSTNVKRLSILANRYGVYGSIIVNFDWENIDFSEKEVEEGYVESDEELSDEELLEDLEEDL